MVRACPENYQSLLRFTCLTRIVSGKTPNIVQGYLDFTDILH